MLASPEAICCRYFLQQYPSSRHHTELVANNRFLCLGILDFKSKNLSKTSTNIFIHVPVLPLHSSPWETGIHNPTTKTSLSLFFHAEKKKILKEENTDSLKKEQQAAWSYSQAKLQLYQVGFNLSGQALAISSLSGTLSPHPITLLLTPHWESSHKYFSCHKTTSPSHSHCNNFCLGANL